MFHVVSPWRASQIIARSDVERAHALEAGDAAGVDARQRLQVLARRPLGSDDREQDGDVEVVDGREVAEPEDGAGGDEARVLRYLRGYTVFNAEQLTDCPEQYLRAPKVDLAAREAARNAILDAIPAVIELGGGSAFYQRDRDVIRLPPPEAFRSVDDFLATKAHEQLHWSGAEHRLNRTFGRRFGDQAYAFEELVAEIGAAALGLRIGLRPQLLDDHAAYLAHWAKILKDRPSALLEASGHAQRAVDHLIAYSQAGSEAVAQAA